MKKRIAKISLSRRHVVIVNCQLLMVLCCFWGCKPEEPKPGSTEPATTHLAYILNEGMWGGNNAEISVLDSNGIVNDWFSRNNGRGLGDVAQDMIHYGSKLYVSVYVSNTVEVVDAVTGKSVKQIDMGQRGPRYMAMHGGKVYVTCYDRSVVRIDTATLSIEASCPLSGMQPEGICEVGGKLYVCNSWQYDDNGNSMYDNTLSAVDIATFTEVDKFELAVNPNRIKSLDDHTVVVACAGDYATAAPATLMVDVRDYSIRHLDVAASNFDVKDGSIYLYNITYDADWNQTAQFYRSEAGTTTTVPILSEYAGKLSQAYGISVHPTTGDIYVTTGAYGANSDLFIFSEGQEIRSEEAGIYASKVIF